MKRIHAVDMEMEEDYGAVKGTCSGGFNEVSAA
jgi:hypothetical protein